MTTKRKRVSKKSKRSWRKNVDISDVDNFIQDQLLQERLGVKYEEEKDENLFIYDNVGNINGDEVIEQTSHNVFGNTFGEILYERHSMRLIETETPKCFEILEKRSAVPVPLQINKRKEKNKTDHKVLKKKLKDKISKSPKNSKSQVKSNKKEIDKPQLPYDIWGEKREKSLNTEWFMDDTLRHNLQNTGQLKKQIPKTIHSKTSLLPAVEFPHPGISYNPSFKDHQDVLRKVAEKEFQIIKEEKHLDRVTSDMFSMVSKKQQEEDWLAEMTVGLSATKDESDEDDGLEYKALNAPVRNKKKTLQKRRKLREALLLKEKLKNQKVNKKKLSDIYKLRIFNESITKKENRILEKMKKRQEKKKQKPFMTKSLSQIKYQEPDLDFNLSEELSGNLRNIKPEGNLLFERYKSLQKRNILEPTVKRKGTRAKVKQYERDNTKLDWELENKKSLYKMKKHFKK